MGTTRIEFWSRERFEESDVPNPVCDLCHEQLTDFPAPVVHHAFDYGLITQRGGYFLTGGMAMCQDCFDKTAKELTEKGEEVITEYDCGCKTQKVGTQFFVKPCSLTCDTYHLILIQSAKRGNRIEFRGGL